jgi:hypothetical protein
MAGQGYAPSLGSRPSVLPSPTSFLSYSLLANSTTVLQWATDNAQGNSNVVADVNLLTPLGASCLVQMPVASNRALGEVGLFLNAGGPTYTIVDASGNTLIFVPSGQAVFLCLTNNLTPEGAWIGFTFGAGIAVANSASLAGPGLGATSTLLQQVMNVVTLAVDYTVTLADRDNLINWTGGTGTLTLPLAADVHNNFYIQIRNSGTGAWTIQPTGSDTINNATALTLNVGDSAFLVSDGFNWFTIGLGIVNTNIFNFQAISLAGLSGTYILPPAQQGKVAYRFTGALTGDIDIQVPSTIQQYWIDNETTGGVFGIGTASQIAGLNQLFITGGTAAILYCDGINVILADTSGISLPVAINQGGTGATNASVALTNLGGTSTGVALFTAASAANARSTLDVLSSSDAAAFAWIF